jgi:DNA-binding SARP family transcriptional activator
MSAQNSYILSLLGGFRLTARSGSVLLRPVSQRLIALLAVLGSQSRAAVAAALWPDLGSPRDSSNLRTIIWRMRKEHPGLLLGDGDELELGQVKCDLDEVREWIRRTFAGEQPWPYPAHAAAVLLPAWDEDWLTGSREELRVLQLTTLELSSQRFLMSGRLPEACSCALAAVTMDPLRESAARLLIEIHLREGNTVDALRRYHRFCQLLDREIGVPPGPSIKALAASIDPGHGYAGASLRRVGPPA